MGQRAIFWQRPMPILRASLQKRATGERSISHAVSDRMHCTAGWIANQRPKSSRGIRSNCMLCGCCRHHMIWQFVSGGYSVLPSICGCSGWEQHATTDLDSKEHAKYQASHCRRLYAASFAVDASAVKSYAQYSVLGLNWRVQRPSAGLPLSH